MTRSGAKKEASYPKSNIVINEIRVALIGELSCLFVLVESPSVVIQ
jgi:hypothetical protein